jgi:hypothetical protein
MTASRSQPSNGQQHRPFKTWKTHMIESQGDYRDEAFLEEYLGGPLYEHQHQMPKLPISSIQETLDRFLPTALPLAKTDEERMALMEACQAFPEQAKALQQRLLARQREFKDSSWLQLWWNQVSGVEWSGVDDPNASEQYLYSLEPIMICVPYAHIYIYIYIR